MWRNRSLQVFAVLVVLMACGMARADTILNPSFELPAVSDYGYGITDWTTASAGFGVLKNLGAHGNLMANCDGSQFAFMPAYTDEGSREMWQDLPTTFEVGKTYTLTVGVGARSDEPMPDATLDVRLFYRPETGSNESPTVATTTVAWNSLSNSESLITPRPPSRCGLETRALGRPWAFISRCRWMLRPRIRTGHWITCG